jgi:hypothetical protein
MNVNVIVFNVSEDFRAADLGDRRKDRNEQFARSFSNSDVDRAEVIDLISQDGAWVGEGSTKPPQTDTHIHTRQPKSLLAASPMATVYNQKGKVRYSAQDKGLRIDITA